MNESIDKLLFAAASALAEGAEQRAFLDYACRDDPERFVRLAELLEMSRDADEFFEIHPEVPAPAEDGAAEAVDADPAHAGIGARIGPYHLIDRLGAGGCGVVYLAEQRVPVHRKVALKIIRMGMDTENVIARFSLEREALARMDHPNIARVLDAGATASGRPYFVMELVDGEKITDFCNHHGLGVRRRLELFLAVCDAVQHAHQKGIIHRDLKPSNIIVREQAGRLVPMVIDFGIAKATAGGPPSDATATRPGRSIGTPAYMSPEQAAGGPDIDTRSDLYSLGILLYELLTGDTPPGQEMSISADGEILPPTLQDLPTGTPSTHLGRLSREQLARIAAQRGSDPFRLRAMLSGDLDWIVMKAIEKDRRRRYESADALAMDVRRHLAEEPVLARPPSPFYLLAKLVRRNRISFTAAAIALAGLLGGLGLSTRMFFLEREARQEQTRLRDIAEAALANEGRLRKDAEAADAFAQAAVLLRYKENQQADTLVSDLPEERIPRTLEAVTTLMDLAHWHLEQGNPQTATERFRTLAHLLTTVDPSDSRLISHEFLPTLTALCEWGAPGQYQRSRTLLVRRFADSSNPDVAEQVVKAALMAPADLETLAGLQPLAEVLMKSLESPERTGDRHLVAWRHFSLALHSYRCGRDDEAAEWIRRSLATATNSRPRAVSCRILSAMVALRSGNRKSAFTELADLRRQIDALPTEPFRVRTEDGLWSNWGIARILLREAEAIARELAEAAEPGANP